MGFSKKLDESDNATPRKPSNKKKGDWGESIAREHMVSMGCAIMEEKWTSGRYEVDLIAQKGARIHFVEVKARSSADFDPAMAVNSKKQRHIITSADAYLRMYNIPFEYQFDIISIIGNEEHYTVEYIPDAYFPSPR